MTGGHTWNTQTIPRMKGERRKENGGFKNYETIMFQFVVINFKI